MTYSGRIRVFIHFRANSLPTSPISMLKSFNLQTHKQTSEQTCTNSDQKICNPYNKIVGHKIQ